MHFIRMVIFQRTAVKDWVAVKELKFQLPILVYNNLILT